MRWRQPPTGAERSHPGETRGERRAPEQLVPLLLEWLGPASRGRSGQIIQA
jgi:hypothetical protein